MSINHELYEDLAYCFDGTLEGLLTCIFESYARAENPSDVWSESMAAPRLLQRVSRIDTDPAKAERVYNGIVRRFGKRTFNAIKKASVSSDGNASTYAYKFVRYAIDEHGGKGRPLSNIAHPSVEPLIKVCRSVSNECEHMREFLRFQNVKADDIEFWFARINPKHAVVPLIMDHFIERFSIQAFLIYDETHGVCGKYDSADWCLIQIDDRSTFEGLVPESTSKEIEIQDAWRRFYRCVSIDERYNPELRRHFMPKRFWSNITELTDVL